MEVMNRRSDSSISTPAHGVTDPSCGRPAIQPTLQHVLRTDQQLSTAPRIRIPVIHSTNQSLQNKYFHSRLHFVIAYFKDVIFCFQYLFSLHRGFMNSLQQSYNHTLKRPTTAVRCTSTCGLNDLWIRCQPPLKMTCGCAKTRIANSLSDVRKANLYNFRRHYVDKRQWRLLTIKR